MPVCDIHKQQSRHGAKDLVTEEAVLPLTCLQQGRWNTLPVFGKTMISSSMWTGLVFGVRNRFRVDKSALSETSTSRDSLLSLLSLGLLAPLLEAWRSERQKMQPIRNTLRSKEHISNEMMNVPISMAFTQEQTKEQGLKLVRTQH